MLVPAAADRQYLGAPVMIALGAAVALELAADGGRAATETACDLPDAEAFADKIV